VRENVSHAMNVRVTVPRRAMNDPAILAPLRVLPGREPRCSHLGGGDSAPLVPRSRVSRVRSTPHSQLEIMPILADSDIFYENNLKSVRL
jgi:hypothetical protein